MLTADKEMIQKQPHSALRFLTCGTQGCGMGVRSGAER